MNVDSHRPTVHLLRQKLDDTRRALDEACSVLQEISPATPSVEAFPIINDGTMISHDESSTESHARHKPSLNFLAEPGLPAPVVSTPSIYCLDIIEMEGSVKAQLIAQMSLPLEDRSSLDTLIQNALLALVTERWTWTTQWYFETLGLQKLGPITRYRILPTLENYQALQPHFRPTTLQLFKFHWPIIDWNPFPALRDKMIEHADKINLNDVILSSMQSFCLEMEVPHTYPRQPSATGLGRGNEEVGHSSSASQYRYYRLAEYLDFLREQDKPSRTGSTDQTRLQMSKAVEAKFILSLRDDGARFKLEPPFFHRFPMLYCDEAAVRGDYASIFDC